MFDGILKSKFHNKCKSNIKLTKARLEAIRKKKNAVLKYLKNDIADLLKNALDINAYGRAEGLLIEQNRSTCYEFIEEYCGCIYSHLSVMQKQRDCPEECKEAVASLMYAAARFADLPELRDLRTTFTEKYGNSVESCTNTELVERLRSNPPTKEMKLQLLKDIAQESNIEWDSKRLEQTLYNTNVIKQVHPKCSPLSNDEDHKWQKNKDGAVPARENQNGGNRLSTGRDLNTKRIDRDFNFHGRKDVTDDRYKMPSSSGEEMTKDLSQDELKNSSSSVGSFSEQEIESKRPLNYRFMPPPYHKVKADKNQSSPEESTKSKDPIDKEVSQHTDNLVVEDKTKPRSVRRRNLKPPPGQDNIGRSKGDGDMKTDSSGTKLENARRGLQTIDSVHGDPRDEEERKLDGLLMQYSNKQSPGEEGRKLVGPPIPYSKKKSPYESDKTNAYLKSPPSHQRDHDYGEHRRNKIRSDLNAPPARATSLPPEPTSPEATRRHIRATSLQPELLSVASHVHPKLPEYDQLAARVAALRGR
ncbi:IST1-like protein [Morella rubra]|uniref:IST1-like protein n=1 Tax=Morella rubra TaxID=262757 RepID=A0A6A1W005_9ROSI|nr:IST1-like protein [Morella rubra]KAB1226708.1 IST1-like protein [Morella rubra]